MTATHSDRPLDWMPKYWQTEGAKAGLPVEQMLAEGMEATFERLMS